MLGDFAIFYTENVNNDSFWAVTDFRLHDLSHNEVALRDDALEVDLLLWPMGNAQLLKQLFHSVATIRHRRIVLDIVFGPIAIQRGQIVIAEKLLIGLKDNRLVFLSELILLHDDLLGWFCRFPTRGSREGGRGDEGGGKEFEVFHLVSFLEIGCQLSARATRTVSTYCRMRMIRPSLNS